jgi:hypothetical protein
MKEKEILTTVLLDLPFRALQVDLQIMVARHRVQF